MKIFTAEQIRKADQFTIENEPIQSIDLMERAAFHLFQRIVEIVTEKVPVIIFCGVGNNGGDGLVLARLLIEKGVDVRVYVVRFSDKSSVDFNTNFDRLKALKDEVINEINSVDDFPRLENHPVVVDAIFGSGLSRKVEGMAAEVIEEINKINGFVISVDVPSGLFCENNQGNDGAILEAQLTLTFQYPKLAFFFHENARYVGDFEVINIGLLPEFEVKEPSAYHFVTPPLIQGIYRKRRKFSHKGTFGHALLLAGSEGKVGAAILAANSCLKSGVGLLTVGTPKVGYVPLQTAVPEAMCITLGETVLTETPDIKSFKTVAIGPGIGTDDRTAHLLKMMIQNVGNPMVIDADALNILAENTTWLNFLPTGSILTPHPGELARFSGRVELGWDRLEVAKDMAVRYRVYLIVKGANTQIVCPDGNVFFNSTGNPGMATGGSGDVLTGLLAGLLAQGYPPKQAAILGVFLHGRSGDLAAENLSEEAITAKDIIGFLPKAWKSI